MSLGASVDGALDSLFESSLRKAAHLRGYLVLRHLLAQRGETLQQVVLTGTAVVALTETTVLKWFAKQDAHEVASRAAAARQAWSNSVPLNVESSNVVLAPRIVGQMAPPRALYEFWDKQMRQNQNLEYGVSTGETRRLERVLRLSGLDHLALRVQSTLKDCPSLKGPAHGDFHSRNALVDRTKKLWLIDLDCFDQNGEQLFDLWRLRQDFRPQDSGCLPSMAGLNRSEDIGIVDKSYRLHRLGLSLRYRHRRFNPRIVGRQVETALS